MYDCVIIGAGISGMVLARVLHDAGMNICIVDDSQKGSASRVAAGLVNPITGKRFGISWRYEEFLHSAKHLYQAYSNIDSSPNYLEEYPMLRFFSDEKEAGLFHAKFADGFGSEYVGERIAPHSTSVHPTIKNHYGGFRTCNAHVFHYAGFLDASRKAFKSKIIDGYVNPSSIHMDLEIWNVPINNEVIYSKTLVYCDGWKGAQNSWLDDLHLKFDIVKGELCIIEAPQLPQTDILSRGFAIIPIGNGRFRCAATFQWNEMNTIPTEFGSDRLNNRIQSMINCSFEILEYSAGLRPTMFNHIPFAGPHPMHQGLYMIGGLGTKGALYAPYMAQLIARHILDGTMPDAELNPAREYTSRTMN